MVVPRSYGILAQLGATKQADGHIFNETGVVCQW
jgi:hypothetical protein